MKASVERLRWGLAGAAVLLVVVLAGFLSYGRYKARKAWQDFVKRTGIHISHETDGFTYSQSMQGRTVFTLHAAKAVDHGDGKWTLHDVNVTLYSKTSSDEDHIQSADVEYDQNSGVATAVGEVHMDLQAPGALAPRAVAGKVAPAAGKAAPVTVNADGEAVGEHVIHIRTSGLVYVKKLGVAATDQAVEFRYQGMTCTAKGAEFDSGASKLHLLADVVMNGVVRNAPMVVHAQKADLDRQANTVALVRPVAQSQGRTAAAANALLHLRKDGSLEQAEGSGGVSMDAGTRHLTATAFAGTFGLTGLPVASKVMGNVVMTDTSAVRPMHAQANEVDASFDAQGNATSLLGLGSPVVTFADRKPGVPELAREMRGDRILATFKPVSVAGGKAGAHKSVSKLSEIHATGSAMASGESVAKATATQAAGLKSTQVFADDLRAVFDANAVPNSELRQVFGNGHTRLKQDAPLGEEQTSSGDTLEVEFAQGADAKTGDGGLQISSATQAGNVVIHSVPAARPGSAKAEVASDASAAKAVYDGTTSRLTLTGSARYTQGDTSLTAETIGVNQHTGDADAQGRVLASMASAQAGAKPGAAPVATEQQMTHVTAARASMARATEVAEFFGTDAHPARLWQGASEVEAATLVFDQKKRSLVARPGAAGELVHSVFADSSQPGEKKPVTSGGKKPAGGLKLSQGDDKIVRVTSATLDYSDLDRVATFTGGVAVDGTSGQAHSQRGVVTLNPAKAGAKPSSGQPTPFGGSVQKIVLSGDVHIAQPGRTGTGEQLVYTAADSSYVLTGTPSKAPHVVDAQQGNVTGASLLFHSGDDAIIVSGGAPGTKQEKPGRVRTETQVKQK
jgi:lipopolysaccharide export system protein LptA